MSSAGETTNVPRYDFTEQFAAEQARNQEIDVFFSRWYTVAPVSRENERRGRDRIFRRPDGSTFYAEYKTDHLSAKTGRAFIETVSVADKHGNVRRDGWAYTFQAELLVYYMPGLTSTTYGREANPHGAPIDLLAIERETFIEALESWHRYRTSRPVQNDGYTSAGLLVPIAELAAIAHVIGRVSDARYADPSEAGAGRERTTQPPQSSTAGAGHAGQTGHASYGGNPVAPEDDTSVEYWLAVLAAPEYREFFS